MNQYIIYRHQNLTTQKSYIGYTYKTIEQRWKEHCALSTNGSKYKFHRAIKKYGIDNWQHEILETCNSIQEVKSNEQYWIEFYDTMHSGYNMTSGGDGLYEPDEETRFKIGSGRRNKHCSQEQRSKISASVKSTMTEELKEKIRARTKEAMTPEIRQKIGKAFFNRSIEKQKQIGVLNRVAVEQYDLSFNSPASCVPVRLPIA